MVNKILPPPLTFELSFVGESMLGTIGGHRLGTEKVNGVDTIAQQPLLELGTEQSRVVSEVNEGGERKALGKNGKKDDKVLSLFLSFQPRQSTKVLRCGVRSGRKR